MKRVHLWPYILLIFFGVFLGLMFNHIILLAIAFIACLLGSFGLAYHLTVDEHLNL